MIKGNSFAKLLFDEERDSGEEYDTDEEEMILELKEEKKRGKLAKKGNSGTKLERSSSDLAKLSELEEYVLTDSQSIFADENSNDPTTPSYSKFLYNITPEEKEKRERRRQYFGCQKSPQQLPLQAETNVNKKLTDQLQILEQNCQTKGDKWRSYAYRKAIAVLKSTKFEIKTAEQAKKLRGIGAKIADKIGEILSTGTLRRIKSEAEDEMTKTLVMFSKVFGAGPETAKKWHAKGYRTIDDLKKSDKLTQQQKIGVKYYEEFQKRIPREEVDTLSGMVYKHALEIDSEFVMEVCGSYRRGKKDCGDIDVLLTHKTNRPIDGAMERLIDALTEIGFLTDHLTDPHKSKENDKYMGVCQWNDLPHRRIDIKIVPKEEWWFALLYFTGSDHFNRSMRLWARRHGYQLTEKHIVKRYAEEVLGEPIPVNSEQDVFAVLGLEYRPPNEREV
jgi:DNA polymerase/3'-5' exonuclease PolX